MTGDLHLVPVAVVGAGVMGSGIAQVAASAGHEVRLCDSLPKVADKAKERIAASLGRLKDKGKIDQAEAEARMARIKVATELAELKGCKLVIEAISEELGAKASLFGRLEEVCGDDVVFATNTSAIPLQQIGAKIKHPERLVGLHFFNPAPVMRLVEVVRHKDVDEGLLPALTSLMEAWGKDPIVVMSAPGFVANRISRPFFVEAMRLHEEEGVPVKVVDECLRSCAGFRMGPFELMDLIGIDVNLANNKGIYQALGDYPRIEPGKVQERMLAKGRLGRKSGQGFYDYGKEKKTAGKENARDGSASHWKLIKGLVQTEGRRASDIGPETAVYDWHLQKQAPSAIAVSFSQGSGERFRAKVREHLAKANVRMHEVPDTPGLVVLRTLSALLAVAADALADGIASLPDMDKAMRLGMNHPFGPKGWLGMIGADAVKRTLAGLDASAPPGRYAPCDLGLLSAN